MAGWICYVLNLSVLLFPLRVPLAPLDLPDSLVALEPRYYHCSAQHEPCQKPQFLTSFIFNMLLNLAQRYNITLQNNTRRHSLYIPFLLFFSLRSSSLLREVVAVISRSLTLLCSALMQVYKLITFYLILGLIQDHPSCTGILCNVPLS